jgi:DNA-binding MarR family transcriptional regulator
MKIEFAGLTDNQRLYMQLGLLWGLIERARNLELAEVGLNIPQASVLYILKIAKEPMTPMSLSRTLQKEPHTMSALVHRMETQGLVSTKKDMKRKNWVRVSLTKKGREALKLWPTKTMVPDVMSCLSKKEADMLLVIIERLQKGYRELLRQVKPAPYNDTLLW